MRFKVMLVVILVLLVASCAEQKSPEVLQIDLPPDELNTKIVLDAPSGWNDFTTGSAIALTVKNVSEDDIAFDPYYGARIFVYLDSGEWKEVENQLISLTSNEVVLRPVKTSPTDMGTTSILPRLDSTDEEKTLRVYIIGYLYENNIKTEIKTGAYLDLYLTP